jgi:RHS repeat-associated protein
MKVSGGQTTVYAYDAFGSLAAEYSTQSAASACVTFTCYLTVDHLGSTRMLTDSNGNAAKLYDYLPFGEELLANQDGRSSLYSSSPDGLGPKFTGQTWDGESSLYWFNVRHMSGAQGRFQGVDPGNAGANLADPQTWNMYAYVGNNPLTYTDPSGMGFWSSLLDAAGFATRIALDFLTFGGNEIFRATLGSGGGGSITSCGGPLGNCGSIGGVFSEESGLGSVQDPSSFVFGFEGSSRLACASDFGSDHSIAAGVGALFPAVNNNAAAKFTVGLFGGNTVSGLINLGLYVGGQKAPGAEDLAKIPLKGVGQGIPLPPGPPSTGRTIWGGATGLARNKAVEAGATAAYNGLRGVGQETIELGISSSVGSSVAGLSAKAAAGAATAVGYAKVAWDLTTFAIGFAKCGN